MKDEEQKAPGSGSGKSAEPPSEPESVPEPGSGPGEEIPIGRPGGPEEFKKLKEAAEQPDAEEQPSDRDEG